MAVNGKDELGATGPGGWGLQVRGTVVIIALMISLQMGLVAYLSDIRSREHMQLSIAINGQARAIRNQTCILSLSLEERAAVRNYVETRNSDFQRVIRLWCPWLESMD